MMPFPIFYFPIKSKRGTHTIIVTREELNILCVLTISKNIITPPVQKNSPVLMFTATH